MAQIPPHSDPSTVIERFRKLPLDCGNLLAPGVDEVEEWQDFSERETTNDQQRIEDVIAKQRLGYGGSLLHVGIGNSGLAERFHPQYQAIAGITIQQNELNRASTLRIANYDARLFNKYTAGLAQLFPRRFDVIVDNNPTSFCCCRTHLYTMMKNYAESLGSGGVILSDRIGLGWTTQPNNANWRIKIEEWFLLGRSVGLEGVSYSSDVAGLVRKPEQT